MQYHIKQIAANLLIILVALMFLFIFGASAMGGSLIMDAYVAMFQLAAGFLVMVVIMAAMIVMFFRVME
jgi:hypothetical protein